MAAWCVFAKVIRAIGITAAVIILLIFFAGGIALMKALNFFREIEGYVGNDSSRSH